MVWRGHPKWGTTLKGCSTRKVENHCYRLIYFWISILGYRPPAKDLVFTHEPLKDSSYSNHNTTSKNCFTKFSKFFIAFIPFSSTDDIWVKSHMWYLTQRHSIISISFLSLSNTGARGHGFTMCLSYRSIAIQRHHDHGNSYNKKAYNWGFA